MGLRGGSGQKPYNKVIIRFLPYVERNPMWPKVLLISQRLSPQVDSFDPLPHPHPQEFTAWLDSLRNEQSL